MAKTKPEKLSDVAPTVHSAAQELRDSVASGGKAGKHLLSLIDFLARRAASFEQQREGARIAMMERDSWKNTLDAAISTFGEMVKKLPAPALPGTDAVSIEHFLRAEVGGGWPAGTVKTLTARTPKDDDELLWLIDRNADGKTLYVEDRNDRTLGTFGDYDAASKWLTERGYQPPPAKMGIWRRPKAMTFAETNYNVAFWEGSRSMQRRVIELCEHVIKTNPHAPPHMSFAMVVADIMQAVKVLNANEKIEAIPSPGPLTVTTALEQDVLRLQKELDDAREVIAILKRDDWTADEKGRSNSSKAYEEVVWAIGDSIKAGAHDLVNNGVPMLARSIASRLAHKMDLTLKPGGTTWRKWMPHRLSDVVDAALSSIPNSKVSVVAELPKTVIG